jgi:hypothetical protein
MGNTNNKLYKNVDMNEFDKCCNSPEKHNNKKNKVEKEKFNKKTKKIKNNVEKEEFNYY